MLKRPIKNIEDLISKLLGSIKCHHEAGISYFSIPLLFLSFVSCLFLSHSVIFKFNPHFFVGFQPGLVGDLHLNFAFMISCLLCYDRGVDGKNRS